MEKGSGSALDELLAKKLYKEPAISIIAMPIMMKS